MLLLDRDSSDVLLLKKLSGSESLRSVLLNGRALDNANEVGVVGLGLVLVAALTMLEVVKVFIDLLVTALILHEFSDLWLDFALPASAAKADGEDADEKGDEDHNADDQVALVATQWARGVALLDNDLLNLGDLLSVLIDDDQLAVLAFDHVLLATLLSPITKDVRAWLIIGTNDGNILVVVVVTFFELTFVLPGGLEG